MKIVYGEHTYTCAPGESVLETLLREGVKAPYSCRKGSCLTCMVRVTSGTVPEESQANLKRTLRSAGFFLPCVCKPTGNLVVVPPADAEVFSRAIVTRVEKLAPTVCRIRLRPAAPLYYRAGQFINIRRDDGLVRSYSLASIPRLDDDLELHVKRMQGGRMSNWVFESLAKGAGLDFQGPNGTCFYVPGKPAQKILLVGTGTGLSPLLGITRDALRAGHTGPIHLYHGSRAVDGLYLRDDLAKLDRGHDNFHYHACISGADVAADCRAGRADSLALADKAKLAGWRVFLSGHPAMVNATQRAAFMAGASMAEIHADPFDFSDLRQAPREQVADRLDIW